MQKAKWKAGHLGSCPGLQLSHSLILRVFSSSFCSSVYLPTIQESESKKGDETIEPEVAVTCFEDEGRCQESRNAGGP